MAPLAPLDVDVEVEVPQRAEEVVGAFDVAAGLGEVGAGVVVGERGVVVALGGAHGDGDGDVAVDDLCGDGDFIVGNALSAEGGLGSGPNVS